MTTTLKITKDDFDAALDAADGVLGTGGIIIYPTDTVYGVGGDATSEEVVKKIAELKQIDPKKPLSVMVGDFGAIDYYCETGIWEDMILGRYLPGPYTFILKKNENRYIPASKTEKLGVRIPDNKFCQYLAQKFKKPIITTSANVTGNLPPMEFGNIEKELIEKVDLAIDGGPTKYVTPSLVVDLVDHKFIREGGTSIPAIEFPER